MTDINITPQLRRCFCLEGGGAFGEILVTNAAAAAREKQAEAFENGIKGLASDLSWDSAVEKLESQHPAQTGQAMPAADFFTNSK